VVEFSTRIREIRGDGGNHHEKLGLNRISCVSSLTIPDMAGTSPDLAGNTIDTRSCKPNQASRTPDFLGPLVSSTSFSSSSPISLFLIHNSTVTQDHEVMSSLSISPCHYQELTLSAAYTEYSIHHVLHHPNIDCLPLPASISSLSRPCWTQFSTFPQLRVNQ